jgi:uncharacterized membrane protein YbhN (UPF0104 family)
MSRSPRSRIAIAVRVVVALITIVACLHLVRELDWSGVLRALRRASIPLIIVAACVNLTQVWFRAIAWSLMLSPVAKVPVRRLFRYNLVAFAASNLLPARSGDLVRMGLIRTREGIAVSTVVAASIVEKCAEAIALLMQALPLPWLIPGLPDWVAHILLVLGAIGSTILVFAWIVTGQWAQRWPWLARFKDGAVIVRQRRVFLALLATVFIEGIVDAATILIVLWAVGIQVHWAAPFLIELSLNTAIALPSTPAHVGAFEMGIMAGLHVLGVDSESALAFALLYHAMELLSVALVGVGGLIFGLRDRADKAEQSEDVKSAVPP